MSFFDWIRNRRQRAVLRRLAKLDAQIAENEARLAELKHIFSQLKEITNYQIAEQGNLAGRIAHLKKIRTHNLQHHDTL